MGLLDRVVGEVSGALSGGEHADLCKAALELLDNQKVGGIQGLSAMLERNGLGDVVRSWVGTGANLPVSGDQLKAALGPDTIARLAERCGIPPERAQQILAQVLPQLVDRLTPNGQVPQQGQSLAQLGLSALQSILGSAPAGTGGQR